MIFRERTNTRFFARSKKNSFMRLREIENVDGEVILTYDEDDERWIWGEYDLSGANLERANLFGVLWMNVILREANLKSADLYWASLFGSDLSRSNCENTDFSGTDLKEVNFTGANLKNAKFGRSNLGTITDLSGANFTDSILDGAKFDHTRYDSKTVFPRGFDPVKNGLICIQTD